MKKLHYLLILLICALSSTVVASSRTPIDAEYFLPTVLRKPLAEYQDGQVLAGHVSRVERGSVWEVFTAREGVPGYRSDNLRVVEKTFPFLETFVVINEERDRIQAVHKDYVQEVYLLPGHEEHTYWFAKRDMLLWRDAMINDEVLVGEYNAEFIRKAMVINRLEMVAEEIMGHGFFNAPQTEAERLAEARSFSVYFVYREQGEYLLLGESQRVTSGNIQVRIRGWVHKQYLSEWNHHLALEMNWENARRRSPARIFENLSAAQRFGSNSNYTPIPGEGRLLFEESPMYTEQAGGYFNRFFVLTEGIDMTNQYPRIGNVGDVKLDGLEDSSCIQTDIPPREMAEIRQRISEGISSRQQVNILFVVDATTSMERYVDNIKPALEVTMQALMDDEEMDIDLHYNLGAFVFRDEHEPIPFAFSNYGEWTDSIPLITSFLDEQMQSRHNTRANPTHPEALFHAMHHSIRIFGPDPRETNYMILIGDAGDNPQSYPHITLESVIDILDRHNFNLLAYQMHHMTDDASTNYRLQHAYCNYRDEIREIIRQLSLRRNQRIHQAVNDFLQENQCDIATIETLRNLFVGFPLDFDDHSLEVDYDEFSQITSELVRSDRYPIIAKFTFPEDDLNIGGIALGDSLEYALQNIAINTYLTIAGLADTGFSPEDAQTARNIFFAQMMDLTLDESLTLIFSFNELYDEGFTAYNPAWLVGEPLYHYTAFLNHNEIQDIAEYINRVIPPDVRVESESLRRAIYDTWERILVRELNLIVPEDFHHSTIAQNITYLTGLPAPEVYKRFTNSDILTSSVLPDSLLMSLCMDLIITRGYLLSILDRGNMFSDPTFFRSYRHYTRTYLQANNIETNLATFNEELSRYFGRRNFANFPRRSIQTHRPDARRYWYYWVDARLLPSEVRSPSEDLRSLAIGQ